MKLNALRNEVNLGCFKTPATRFELIPVKAGDMDPNDEGAQKDRQRQKVGPKDMWTVSEARSRPQYGFSSSLIDVLESIRREPDMGVQGKLEELDTRLDGMTEEEIDDLLNNPEKILGGRAPRSRTLKTSDGMSETYYKIRPFENPDMSATRSEDRSWMREAHKEFLADLEEAKRGNNPVQRSDDVRLEFAKKLVTMIIDDHHLRNTSELKEEIHDKALNRIASALKVSSDEESVRRAIKKAREKHFKRNIEEAIDDYIDGVREQVKYEELITDKEDLEAETLEWLASLFGVAPQRSVIREKVAEKVTEEFYDNEEAGVDEEIQSVKDKILNDMYGTDKDFRLRYDTGNKEFNDIPPPEDEAKTHLKRAVQNANSFDALVRFVSNQQLAMAGLGSTRIAGPDYGGSRDRDPYGDGGVDSKQRQRPLGRRRNVAKAMEKPDEPKERPIKTRKRHDIGF